MGYEDLKGVYDAACKTYELECTPVHIHTYHNYKQSAWSGLKLLLNYNNPHSERMARVAVYALLNWVGRQERRNAYDRRQSN